MRKIILLILIGTSSQIVMAQKEYIPGLITKDQLAKISELVKPINEEFEKRLSEDNSGLYKAYRDELDQLNKISDPKKKRSQSSQLLEKYTPYFKEIWAKMDVDEKSYQQKIKNIFTESTGNLIKFELFLNFTITKTINSASKPESAPPPSRENICLDVCSIASGEITGTSGLISGKAGSYGNCFIKTSAWGVVAGSGFLRGLLKNNIIIPGTFPDDDKKLHVSVTYDVKLEATAISILGLGSAEASVQTSNTTEYVFAGSPIICGVGKTVYKTITEDYILSKKDIGNSFFKSFAGATGILFSANWSVSEINNIRWNICEE